jgi:hypothetical protein
METKNQNKNRFKAVIKIDAPSYQSAEYAMSEYSNILSCKLFTGETAKKRIIARTPAGELLTVHFEMSQGIADQEQIKSTLDLLNDEQNQKLEHGKNPL